MTIEIADFTLSLNNNQLEFFEERAAILQFDGGFSKDVAEIEAMIQTKRYFNI